ncbi:hypothetical protein [Blastopirellula marina]|uniref:Uncharacterized protein n=1 Tax=Blastopirellula marina TaxID=124 RepID=A0A2S8GLD6_9BACT|nr:hypothetical protein [Blastopirellula marina]PQO45220.1 hypothetical protein C5Y93_14755 [Blastopirellula marina]
MSIPAIALCLWGAGALVAIGLEHSVRSYTLSACFSGIAGPGLIGFQQYCGTFRASIAGARFSAWIGGIVAVFVLWILLIEIGGSLRGNSMDPRDWIWVSVTTVIVLVAAASSRLNYLRWQQLLDAQKQGIPVGKSLKFSLVEIMGIMLAMGVVFGGASFAVHR